jgi:shikimate dehydrogenase
MDGNTVIIAHLGYPTASFTAPLIYNPFFAARGINAAVVTMGVTAEDFANLLRPLFKLTNIRGALVTMPHKISVVGLLDEVTPAVEISGSCNAVLKRDDGSLLGQIFDGESFITALTNGGFAVAGQRALIIGCGGMGSAIAASLASYRIGSLSLYDAKHRRASALKDRLLKHFPTLEIRTGCAEPEGHNLVVNASPLGLKDNDPLPLNTSHLSPTMMVSDLVLAQTMTPLLSAALAKGCHIQAGIDVLYEQIPAHLHFFGFPSATLTELRGIVRSDNWGGAELR